MILVRYYFWQKLYTGWRQLGTGDGYKTKKECIKDNYFYIKEKYSYEILKAVPIKDKV